jgi:hypothetical protein
MEMMGILFIWNTSEFVRAKTVREFLTGEWLAQQICGVLRHPARIVGRELFFSALPPANRITKGIRKYTCQKRELWVGGNAVYSCRESRLP